jgi:hypothetical protein
VPAAITWPAVALSPAAMAAAIDHHARAHDVRAIALDGPHAWRDPATPTTSPGVGRRGEYALRTQGKTGVRGTTYPRTQRGWTEFSIAVFAALLDRADVALAAPGVAPPRRGYVVLEAYPTAIWRAAGLAPLPAKRARPDLADHAARLAAAFGLPAFAPTSHDDLQAVVAALAAAGLADGRARAHGVAAARLDGHLGDHLGDHLIEGYVWDVVPPRRAL